MIPQHEESNAIAAIAINRLVCIRTLFGIKDYLRTMIMDSKQNDDYECIQSLEIRPESFTMPGELYC